LTSSASAMWRSPNVANARVYPKDLANHRRRTHLDGELRGVFPDSITSSRPRVSLFFESYGRRSS
jgi:hypothetical protein